MMCIDLLLENIKELDDIIEYFHQIYNDGKKANIS